MDPSDEFGDASALRSSDDVTILREALAHAERRGATLAELTALMSEAHNPLALAQRAVELTAKATRAAGAYVYLWDRDDERLVLRVATEGWQRPHVGSIKLRMGEGITGWSALMRQTVVVPDDPRKDPRFLQFPELREGAFKSMVGVPIVAPGEEVLGVFTLYARTENGFSGADVSLATEVGSLLASGLVQAETLTQLQVQSTAARFLYDVPREAWGSMQRCLEAMAAQCAADMDAEACVLEITTDRTVSQRSIEIMASTEKLKAEHPELTTVGDRQSAKVTQSLDDLGLSRLRIPLAAATPIGAVTCYRAKRFAAEDELLLEAIGAQIAAGTLSVIGAERMRPSLDRLLRSPDPATTETTLLGLGWKRRTTSVSILRVHPLTGTAGEPWDAERVREAFGEVFGEDKRRFAVFGDGGTHLLLVETPDPAAHRAMMDALNALGDRPGVRLTVGTGTQAATLPQLHQAIRHAQLASQWAELSRQSTGGVVSYEDVAHLRLLPHVALSMSGELRDLMGLLGAVVKYDLDSGTDLVQTLEAFLANSGSVTKAADELFVHRNTLRQRIQRIGELIGQSPESFEDWITAGLAARLIRRSESELNAAASRASSARCPNGVLTIGRSCCGMSDNCPMT